METSVGLRQKADSVSSNGLVLACSMPIAHMLNCNHILLNELLLDEFSKQGG